MQPPIDEISFDTRIHRCVDREHADRPHLVRPGTAMNQGGRLEAAIGLLEAIEAAPARPADAVANDFFRERRFIGSGDRRAVSDRVWQVLRSRRRLTWFVTKPTPRLLAAASLL